jgi:hypothetical protein
MASNFSFGEIINGIQLDWWMNMLFLDRLLTDIDQLGLIGMINPTTLVSLQTSGTGPRYSHSMQEKNAQEKITAFSQNPTHPLHAGPADPSL